MSKLKKYRERKGLTQKDFAKISGTTKRMVQDWEQGQRNINGAAGERLYKMALTLGCRIEDLLENKEEIEMDHLERMYAAWRQNAEKHNAWMDEHGGSNPVYWETDCGESYVREDFSEFAHLEETISFEDMLELEENYG